MTNEPSYREKGRAVFLAAIMVLSVVALSVSLAGGAAAHDHDDADAVYNWADSTNDHNDLNGSDVWVGQEFAVEAGGDLRIFEGYYDDEEPEQVAHDRVRSTEQYGIFDASDLEPGVHHIEDREHGVVAEFWVVEQDLDVSFDTSTVGEGNSVELEIDSNRDDGYAINVTSEDFDGDDLAQILSNFDVSVHSEDDDVAVITVPDATETVTQDATFDVDLGEYDFDFDVQDSTASDNASVEVTDDNIDRSFGAGEFTTEQGNLVNVTVELDGSDTGAITLGDEDENGYLSYVEFEDTSDDGYDEITLQFNTHFHMQAANDGWSVHEDYEDVSITDSGTPYGSFSAPLGAMEYEMALGDSFDAGAGDNGEVNEEFDSVYLTIEEKQPPGAMYTEVAPGDQDVVGWEDYQDADTTESQEVADGDHLIGVVPDFGATGAIEVLKGLGVSNGDESLGTVAASEMGIYLEVEQDGVPSHLEGGTWNTSPNDPNAERLNISALNLDDYNGDLIVLIDYEDAGMEAGESYSAHLKITSENPYVSEDEEEILLDSDNYKHRVWAQEPEVSIDSDMDEVPASSNAEITGTANVAPGGEVQVRARSPGNFVDRETVEIDSDGTFTASFDFSEESAGTEFTLRATLDSTYSGDDTEDELDAVLTESTGEPAEPTDGIGLDVSAPTSITVGEDADFDVTVSNYEDDEHTVTYELTIDGETYDGELTIDGDDSASETVTVEGLEEDSYDWEASASANDGEFEDDASGTLTVSAESDDDSDDDDSVDSDDDDDGGDDGEGQPGFGVAVALVALLAAAMLALRRQD